MLRLLTASYCCLSFMGCAVGLLYTDKTESLSLDMDRTPIGVRTGTAATKSISIPMTSLNLSANWDTRAIADAARKAGIVEFSFADIHTTSILLGLWEKQEVIVYGH